MHGHCTASRARCGWHRRRRRSQPRSCSSFPRLASCCSASRSACSNRSAKAAHFAATFRAQVACLLPIGPNGPSYAPRLGLFGVGEEAIRFRGHRRHGRHPHDCRHDRHGRRCVSQVWQAPDVKVPRLPLRISATSFRTLLAVALLACGHGGRGFCQFLRRPASGDRRVATKPDGRSCAGPYRTAASPCRTSSPAPPSSSRADVRPAP